MKKFLSLGTAAIIVLLAIFPLSIAHAERGVPGSSNFGYGAHLNTDAAFLPESLRLANSLSLDWIAVEFPWDQFQSFAGQPMDLRTIDGVMGYCAQKRVPVLLSLSHPPEFIQTENGPSIDKTKEIVLMLLQRYPAIRAVEIYPAANTRAGWGRNPNPRAYSQLMKALFSDLQSLHSTTLLISGGLKPTANSGKDIPDVMFLNQMYTEGAIEWMQVVSLDLGEIVGDPSSTPSGEAPFSLRHYEDIRQVMVANQHQSGLIWITHLNPPSGKIVESGNQSLSPPNPSVWLTQAYEQLQSQLYIGVTFFSSINPDANQFTSLILSNGDYHPFYPELRRMITQSHPLDIDQRPGRPKSDVLAKVRD